MKSYLEYVEAKNNHLFESGIVEILSPVLQGKISFDDLVEQVIVPTFAQNPYAESEFDVLNLLREGMWDKFKNWIGMGGQKQQAQQEPPVVDPQHIAMTDSINQQMQQMISQQLMPVITKISDSLKHTAFKTGNRQLHRAAELFNQKLTQTAQEMKFKVSGTLGDEENKDFNQGRINSRYSPEQLARLEKQKQVRSNRNDGLDDEGGYRLQPTPEELAAKQQAEELAAKQKSPVPFSRSQPMSMQNMTPQQRARLQRKMAQRNANRRSNVIGSVGAPQNNVAQNTSRHSPMASHLL
jgi:hypothetical protein